MLLFATDFMRPYTSDQEEIANHQHWMPSSLDFNQTATNSSGGTGVADFAEFLKAIAATSSNSIDSLGLIGHANQKVLAFGGTMQKDGSITANSNQQISGRIWMPQSKPGPSSPSETASSAQITLRRPLFCLAVIRERMTICSKLCGMPSLWDRAKASSPNWSGAFGTREDEL
jgi:hypothetical protein